MHRREFVKLSAAAAAALFLNRTSYAEGLHRYIGTPEEAWINLDSGWKRMNKKGSSGFVFKGCELSLKKSGNALGAYVHAPEKAVKGFRLKWAYDPAATLLLGDNWERTYGDAGWKNIQTGIKNPWYVLFYTPASTTCFGVKTGANSLCSWVVEKSRLILDLDTHSGGVGVKLGGRELHAADILTYQSKPGETPFAAAQDFCRMMCEKPRLPKQPVYGINDWYYAYGANSPELILKQTALMSELVSNKANLPFSVIDAGWATYSPLLPDDCCWQEDFSRPNSKFKDIHRMAEEIRKLDMRPGLWTRPLCAKHDDKASLLAPAIPGRDNPKNPVLDPTIPENLGRISHNIALYKQWGFDLVKHDFTTYDITGRWGFDMKEETSRQGWYFYDQSKTNAEIINHLYHSIREAADTMYLIGCNTMSHLSAGVFELNRIGDDTSGKEWDRTRKMGVNTLGARMHQHQTFYAVDGDCVGLTNQIPWEKNRQWMQLLAESSAPLFISAQPEAIGPEQKAFITECFKKAAAEQPIAEPLDWLSNPLPSKWRLDNTEVDFDWS